MLTHDEKLKLFETEISYLYNPEAKRFVEDFIDDVPEYFFSVAASSTGKYHPDYALGEGGLIRHTKAAVRIAKGLFQIMNMDLETQDKVIVALIFHDSFKHGYEVDGTYDKYTKSTHPVIASGALRTRYKSTKCEEFANDVADLILTHMGQWNTDWKTKKEIMPKPSNPIQNFVHMCDFLASRKYLEFNFDVGV